MNRLITHPTIETGIQSRPISCLAPYVETHALADTLTLLLVKFRGMFNMKNNLNQEQVEMVVDLIIEMYADLGIGAVWHCLMMIVKGEKPFDEKLFENLDARKVLDALGRYRDLQANYREMLHYQKIERRSFFEGDLDRWGRDKTEHAMQKVNQADSMMATAQKIMVKAKRNK